MPHLSSTTASTPPAHGLWTQAQAAKFLGVSVRYLRNSACPKILLPGNGARGYSVVRYNPTDVVAWASRWGTDRWGKN